MRSFKLFAVAIAVATFVVSSCSIEKRVHRPGYSIKLNKFNSSSDEAKAPRSEKAEVAQLEVKEERVITTNTPSSLIVTESNQSQNVVAEKTEVESKVAIAPAKKNVVKNIFSNKAEVKEVAASNQVTAKDETFSQVAKAKEAAAKKKSSSSRPSKGLLIVLCFFIPWLAVGLATDWDVMPIVYNILWTMLCGIPGIIHGIIVVNREM